MTGVILIVSIAVVILILAFQFIANSILKELRPDSGSSMRDVLDRAEKAAMAMLASVERLEKGQIVMKATGERIEEGGHRLQEAGAVVATELREAQQRAVDVGDHGQPGEAADAAVKPADAASNKPKPMEVTVVNPPHDPVNAEISNPIDRPVPTRATLDRQQERLDQAQDKLDKDKQAVEEAEE